jgi:DNA-binding response OmpR family regulator
MSNLRPILYAEDDPRDRELTLAAFSQSKLANEIVVVIDGEQALDYLYRRAAHSGRQPGSPAFVLLDLKMPKVDGLEVLRQMKGDADLSVIPVIMLTSSREERDLVMSYKSGANAYVVKPIDFGEFVKAVTEISMFWAVINEPPPESSAAAKTAGM